MIKVTEEYQREIKELFKELKNMPYGKDLRHRTIPPSADHYAACYKSLLDILSQYVNSENLLSYQKLLSIRDNQLRELLIFPDKSFERYGVHQKMEELNGLISMTIGCAVSTLQYSEFVSPSTNLLRAHNTGLGYAYQVGGLDGTGRPEACRSMSYTVETCIRIQKINHTASHMIDWHLWMINPMPLGARRCGEDPP